MYLLQQIDIYYKVLTENFAVFTYINAFKMLEVLRIEHSKQKQTPAQ